ncbi:type I-F CRISPR-associated endoribonuclease Cas6/Csy4 [Ideonella azotifigens]|uniref:Type I-F CRISPR-associated endoribonuclease Cas6/Csy4 n=1 Tax=Ideonella azotifigens TaxID=513160 RepID=A0ABP3VSN8_9BURK|nr:type I-F CRISPR-associated endoribonuclease Cas6/Csy4 [Ideonella azotifigens]MCD2340688.1 type I-F CRISPR-associated endoribonuclease Cas6/Csy4 [Ideonella azotifigens]
MHHYIDIHLRPDPEFAPHQLMAALFAKLHRWLAQTQSQHIGVSFPGYQEAPATLGGTLRLIGPATELTRLMEHDWLQGMHDHADVRTLVAVPPEATQRTLRRVQAKSSPERLRRRQMRRHQLTAEQALERVPDSAAETLKLPFLTLTSTSTGQRFKLFLRLGPSTGAEQAGDFNSYGLSSTATVPWF